MRVIKQILRLGNGRIGQSCILEQSRQLGGAVARKTLAQLRQQACALAYPIVVAGVAWVGLEIIKPKHAAKGVPLRVAHGGQKHLLAVFDSEHVINAPGRNAIRHGLGRDACHGVLHHVLADQKHIVLKQRGLHLLAAPADGALHDGAQDGDGAKHAAHDVVDAGARAQRVAGAPGHVGQPAHHLHHFVQGRAVLVRAGQEALEAGVDQARVAWAQSRVVQAVLGQRAGLEVFKNHVGAGAQALRDPGALGVVQIDLDALLVAIEHREKARARAQ